MGTLLLKIKDNSTRTVVQTTDSKAQWVESAGVIPSINWAHIKGTLVLAIQVTTMVLLQSEA